VKVLFLLRAEQSDAVDCLLRVVTTGRGAIRIEDRFDLRLRQATAVLKTGRRNFFDQTPMIGLSEHFCCTGQGSVKDVLFLFLRFMANHR
jgi:hypothetical protein